MAKSDLNIDEAVAEAFGNKPAPKPAQAKQAQPAPKPAAGSPEAALRRMGVTTFPPPMPAPPKADAGIIDLGAIDKAVANATQGTTPTQGQTTTTQTQQPTGVKSKVDQFLRRAQKARSETAEALARPFKQLYGVAEAGTTALTGATTGVLGGWGGLIKGTVESIESGTFGTQKGERQAVAEAAKGMEALTYSPRTEAGQALVKGAGDLAGEYLPPILPVIGAPGQVAAGTRAAASQLAVPVKQALTATEREAGYVAGAAKQAGQAATKVATAVTPAPVRAAVAKVAEAVAPGVTTPAKAPVGAAPKPQAGRVSAGAAATPDAAMIQAALETATPEFKNLYGKMPLDKLNTPVVLRHLEADSLPIPIRLMEGQATGNLVKLSHEHNLRGKHPEYAQRFNEQNQQLVDNVPLIREQAAPDVYATKTIESSEAIINAYKQLDAERTASISAAYKALEDAAGGQFPVDGVALAQAAEASLAKKLKTDFLSSPIKSQLEKFKAGEPMTFEQFEAMRTNLAAEIRKAERAGDGNSAMAASLVRDAMEQLPLKGDAAQLKPLADEARALAKARFDAIKKDPAYKAAIDDAVPADKFMDRYVINGVNKNINTMVETLGRNSEAHQHMRAGTINWLSDKAGIVDGRGNFSQNTYNKALKKLDDVRNLEAIFEPQSRLQLKTLGNVAAYTQFQPRGSFVNNSNTLVGAMAEKAAGGLEQLGNIAGLKTVGYPIGSEIRRGIVRAKEKGEVEKSLAPGAGSYLKDMIKSRE